MQKDHQPRHQQAPHRHLFSSSSSPSSSGSASYRRYLVPTASVELRPSDSSTTDFSPCLDIDSSSDSSTRQALTHSPTASCRVIPTVCATPPPDCHARVAGVTVEKSIYVTKQDAVAQSSWAEDTKQDGHAAKPTLRALNVQKQATAELALVRNPPIRSSKQDGSKGAGLPTYEESFTAPLKSIDAVGALAESDSELTTFPARASSVPEPASVNRRANVTANSIKASSRENESLFASDGSITAGYPMKRSPVHQSDSKRRAHIDRLSRYVAENQTSGDYKGMPCKSLQDARIESPSPPTSWRSKQNLTRSPRSPDPLLIYDSVKTIHTVKTTPSKWDDAEKWLSSPPNQPKIATISCYNAQGCGGFAAHSLFLLGKSSNPASLNSAAPEKQQFGWLAEPHQNKLSSRQLAPHHPNPQALQQQSNRRVKHRNAPPSPPPQGQAEMRRSFEKERLASIDLRHESANPSWTGTSNSESILHSPQDARMLPPNDSAVPSMMAIPIDRTQRGCPSPVPVMEKKTTCQKSAHRCAECGSTFSDVSSTDSLLAVNKYARGNAKTRELSIMDDAVQTQSPFKDRVIVSVVLKDAGTQITPVESSSNTTRYSSKCPSPARHNTPARPSRSPPLMARSSGLDLVELARCHRAKLELQGLSEGERIHSFHRSHSNWSSREAEEEEIGKSLRHLDLEDRCTDSAAAEPSTWLSSTRKDERGKNVARLKHEEDRIQAWENQKKAKADVQLRKLEAKLEKRRAQSTDKITSKLIAAQRQAQRMRTQIRAQQTEFKSGSTPKALNEFLQMHLCACFTSTLHCPSI